jgi:hypothetical protein
VVVACAEMLSPRTVVVPYPVDEIESADCDDVAKPVTVVVPTSSVPSVSVRSVHCGTPAPAESASCGEVAEKKLVIHGVVVVPTASAPAKVDVAVVVESKLPTVNCVPVAMSVPAAPDVMIELLAKVVAVVIQVVQVIAPPPEPSTSNEVPPSGAENETVEVADVCTSPDDPTYVTPCVRAERRTGPESVDDAVEKKPPAMKPIVVEVELYPATEVNGNDEEVLHVAE